MEDWLWQPHSWLTTSQEFWSSLGWEIQWMVGSVLFAALLVHLLVLRRRRAKASKLAKAAPANTQRPHVRKRDIYYELGKDVLETSKKLLRNPVFPARSNSIVPGQRVRRRDRFHTFVQSILDGKTIFGPTRDNGIPLRAVQLNTSFYEADESDDEVPAIEPMSASSAGKMPYDLIYVLKSIEVFGGLPDKYFLHLYRHVDTICVRAGEKLFEVGDMDDRMYIVLDGLLSVKIKHENGRTYTVTKAKPGDSVVSLLSMLEALTGRPSTFKTVSATAEINTTVLVVPAAAFSELAAQEPKVVVRILRMIILRLHRVSFLTLVKYLGLSKELIVDTPSSRDAANAEFQAESACKQREEGKKFTRSESSMSSTKDGPATNAALFHAVAAVASHMELPSFAEVSRQQRLLSDSSPQATLKPAPHRRITVIPDGPPALVKEAKVEAVMRFARALEVGPAGVNILLANVNARVYTAKPGDKLFVEGQMHPNLFFLASGIASVHLKSAHNDDVTMHFAEPGEVVGLLAMLSDEQCYLTGICETECCVVEITRIEFEEFVEEEQKFFFNVARLIPARLSGFVRQVDFALQWVNIKAGRALYRQDDEATSFFIVLNGRLRSVQRQQGQTNSMMLADSGRGQLIGVIEILSGKEKRASTVHAARDTELTRVPVGLFTLICDRYPMSVAHFYRLVGNGVIGNLPTTSTNSTTPSRLGPGLSHLIYMNEGKQETDVKLNQNLSTIALIPVSTDVPLRKFTTQLLAALVKIGPVKHLTSSIIRQRFGETTSYRDHEVSLMTWLGQMEDRHRLVLYEADHTLTAWTKRCIRQADCILIVGVAGQSTALSEMEFRIEHVSHRVLKELVLLHNVDLKQPPKGTAEWLNARPWCHRHHHIRCAASLFDEVKPSPTPETLPPVKPCIQRLGSLSDMEVDPEVEALAAAPMSPHSDFARLARWLTGNSLGVVLGGGGARGGAHVGCLRALLEGGYPIDIIGGTSMGAFVGALYAISVDIDICDQMMSDSMTRMASTWRKVLDLTYPVTAMFTGHAFNMEILDAMGEDRRIEDLWIPYFCVSTDIMESRMRIHADGSLWRYVRASMTLAGFLPPMCDPRDHHYLLDGGYVNNLPADVMEQKFGAKTVIAIDVGAKDNNDYENFGDSLSGWWVLWRKWNPFLSSVRVPTMSDIQGRLAYVSNAAQLELVNSHAEWHVVMPPVGIFQTLQFGAYHQVKEVGYRHLVERLKSWKNKPVNGIFHQPKTDLFNLTSISSAKEKFVIPPFRSEHSHAFDEDDEDEFDDVHELPSRGRSHSRAGDQPRALNHRYSISGFQEMGGSGGGSEEGEDADYNHENPARPRAMSM